MKHVSIHTLKKALVLFVASCIFPIKGNPLNGFSLNIADSYKQNVDNGFVTATIEENGLRKCKTTSQDGDGYSISREYDYSYTVNINLSCGLFRIRRDTGVIL